MPPNFESIRGLDFEEASSWAQIELFAAVSGIPVDGGFMSALIYASIYYDGVFMSMLSGIRNGDIPREAVGSDVFLEAVVGISTAKKGTEWFTEREWQFTVWFQNAFGKRLPGRSAEKMSEKRRKVKYWTMNVVFDRFPADVIRFYSRHMNRLHSADDGFVAWFRQKVSELPDDGKTGKLKRVVLDEISRQCGKTKFLR